MVDQHNLTGCDLIPYGHSSRRGVGCTGRIIEQVRCQLLEPGDDGAEHPLGDPPTGERCPDHLSPAFNKLYSVIGRPSSRPSNCCGPGWCRHSSRCAQSGN
jgi:hypothetical protein